MMDVLCRHCEVQAVTHKLFFLGKIFDLQTREFFERAVPFSC